MMKFMINKKECDLFIKKLKELSEVKLEIQELKRRVEILENPVHEREPIAFFFGENKGFENE